MIIFKTIYLFFNHNNFTAFKTSMIRQQNSNHSCTSTTL